MNAGDLKVRRRFGALAYTVASTLALAQQARAADEPKDDQVIDRVIVTAQKKEEDLIDVPIAVSAFDETAMARKQIDQATDLQLNIPNVSYSKTNFTGSNFQIRGIGVSSIGASSDSGVEIHFNSMAIKNPRLFETEYFDVQRVEVLRGPQGTLYGRNATGGAVNVIANKPNTDALGADFEVEAGDYSARKVKGAVNVPLGEQWAFRAAGIWFERDGYAKNLFTGNDIDGRDQWAARASLRFRPSADTDVTLTVNRYEEDSTRARTLKQMCHRDPTGAYGCLPDRLAFETVNGNATLGGLYAGIVPVLVNAPPLVAGLADLNQNAINPPDLRTVSAEFDPRYKADETLATLEITHDFSSFSLISVTGFQETMFVGNTDYNWNSPTGPYTGPGLAAFGGSIPLTSLSAPSALGSLSGNPSDIYLRTDRSYGYDRSDQEADQWSQELRLQSQFDGKWNFQLGAFYFDSDDAENYSIATTELDYAGVILGLKTPYYINATPSASLKSSALFGELYFDQTDSFRWTGGLRWTRDEKGIEDRQLLFSVPVAAALPAFRKDETTFKEFTGRFGFDWKPGWFDDSTLYAFYSRGYKAGGFNPPLDRTNPAFAGTPEVYDPEFLNAFEVGTKNLFAGGSVQANLTAFYYDYSGLQVSKIISRTSVNENIDSEIFGLEGEFIFQPTDALAIDMNVAYLKTKIKDTQSVDPRDLSNGNPGLTVLKDVFTGANYTVPTAALAAATGAGCILPGSRFGLFSASVPLCNNAAAAFGISDGEQADLDGNELAGAPELSAKIGAQYTWDIGEFQLTARADYYWRDDFFARIYNRPIDEIKSWDVTNAQVEFAPRGRDWYLRGYVNNLADDDNITGMYVTDAASGLFTNVFALDPRTYGLVFGMKF